MMIVRLLYRQFKTLGITAKIENLQVTLPQYTEQAEKKTAQKHWEAIHRDQPWADIMNP